MRLLVLLLLALCVVQPAVADEAGVGKDGKVIVIIDGPGAGGPGSGGGGGGPSCHTEELEPWDGGGATGGEPVYLVARLVCSDGTTTTGSVCVANCPAGAPGAFVPDPTPQEARDALQVPLPIARLSPSLDDARNGTAGGYLVGLPMYVAVDPGAWRPLTASATAAGKTISVVATPIRLDVDVDGEHLDCDGPGEIVTSANRRTTTSTCRHLFTTRGTATISMRIVYAHTYSANFPQAVLPVGETGTSPTLTATLPVVEAQPLLEVLGVSVPER